MWFIGAAIILLVLEEAAVRDELLAIAATGKTELDQPAVRGRVVTYARSTFGDEALRGRPALLRALMAVCNNEYNRQRPLTDQVGDRASGVGPSVGPMQVSRQLAIDLGLWAPPEGASDVSARLAYESMASNLDFCFSAGVLAFASKLQDADDDVVDAIRRYNGGGDRARGYREKALAFATGTWGDDWREGAIA